MHTYTAKKDLRRVLDAREGFKERKEEKEKKEGQKFFFFMMRLFQDFRVLMICRQLMDNGQLSSRIQEVSAKVLPGSASF